MKKISYIDETGRLNIEHPAYGVRKDLTDDDVLHRALMLVQSRGVADIKIVDDADIPKDRTFRNAWGTNFVVDMAKAVEIQKDTLRFMRAQKLIDTDIEFLKAIEVGDVAKQAAVSAKKQALRDVTNDPRLASAKTPEELKAIIPEILL